MTATVPCKKCHQPIGESSPYFERQVGPHCGGRIRKPRAARKPATTKRTPAPLPGAALETSPDQLELFYLHVLVVTRD
jgi:hypothetical protein